MTTLIAIFLIFHGIFHLWYVIVSLRLIEYKPWMGYFSYIPWDISPLVCHCQPAVD